MRTPFGELIVGLSHAVVSWCDGVYILVDPLLAAVNDGSCGRWWIGVGLVVLAGGHGGLEICTASEVFDSVQPVLVQSSQGWFSPAGFWFSPAFS